MQKIRFIWVPVLLLALVLFCGIVANGANLVFFPGNSLKSYAQSSDMTVTRGQFYTMLATGANVVVDNTIATNMTDVLPNQSYTGSVIWAISNGIATCEASNKFGVDTPITRWEVALALYRYHSNVQPTSFTVKFAQTAPDLGGLTPESLAAIGYACGSEVICRCDDGLFQPYSNPTFTGVETILENFFALPPVTSAVVTIGQTTFSSSAEPATDIPSLTMEAEKLVEPEVETTTPTLDASQGWTGNWEEDFPLTVPENVTFNSVIDLNQRILLENVPGFVSLYGDSVDDVDNHLTNYGSYGLTDCINVNTILYNKTSDVEAGLALNGRQQYYGYSLQIIGIDQQDYWHQGAEETGKDPWQCTWWAWGRAAQYMDLRYNLDLLALCNGKELMGNGMDYYNNLSPFFLSDWKASANSIVSWSGASYGHVAYVEAVDDYGIWVSMADSGRTWRGITYIVKTDDPNNPYPLGWYANEAFLGFNHLDYDANGYPYG